MAQNLQQLKKRIKTSNSIAQISKAMEMIAASKIRKAQTSVGKYSPFAVKIKNMVQKVISDKDLVGNSLIESYTKAREGKKLIYLIAPDKGLCGGLVVNLFKKLSECAKPEDYIVSVGKKAFNNMPKYDYNNIASFPIGTSFPRYEDIFPMIEIAKKFYLTGQVSGVSVVYTKFKNMLVQEAVCAEIFPVRPVVSAEGAPKVIEYLFEPSIGQVFEDLLPYYFEVEFYDAVMNAYASEQAARMSAMRNAKENADEISDTLTNIYNRSRQEKITNEILDLANGQAAA